MTGAPIVLVPGFWLGAWAWDEVVSILLDQGHEVTAITLPGLESLDRDRAAVTLADHVEAICAAVHAAGEPVVLAVHSGAGLPGYAASDRLPDHIVAMVYVDSGPGIGALDPTMAAPELPLPEWDVLDESLDGLSEAHLAAFRARAIPEPGALLREAPVLSNPARLDIASVVVCTSFPSDQIRAAAAAGQAWVGGLLELRDVTFVDLPTSHWPMWSRPGDVAAILSAVARSQSPIEALTAPGSGNSRT